MILYRPVGLQELELIYDSGMKAFPARLPQQPIFYPVLDLEYARQTASDWNVKNGQYAGYVTQFKMEEDYISRLEKHTVGGSGYQEFWIPAEEVEEFNRHITGHIKVVEAHFGDAFQGFVPDDFGLKGKNAVEQFTLLANSFVYKRMDFYLEIKRNHKAVFLNYPFWQQYNFKNQGLKEKVVQAIRDAWLTSFPRIPLPMPPVTATESQPEVSPVPEEIKPVKQTDSQTLVHPSRREITPLKQKDPHPWVKPVHGNTAPVKRADAKSLPNPAHPETGPARQTGPQSLVDPAPERSEPVRQAESHYVQGVTLGLMGKYHEAIAELSAAVREDPDHVAAHTSLGVAFLRSGENDRALSCYDAALKIDARYAEAHYFRANLLYAQGKVREAIAEYMVAIGLELDLIEADQRPLPEDRLTDYSRLPAGIHRIAGPAQRILALNQRLETHPGQAQLFKERAAEYSRLWNYEQAIADYNSCLAIEPDDASALHARGMAYEQVGQSERAQADYRRAIAINSQLSNGYIDRGVKLGEMGNFRQSIASLTEGIRLAPQNINGYFNRGTTYFQLGDLEKAIADFSRVIQLASNDEDAYYWRGISNEAAGHQDAAISDYRQFLKISQNPRAREEIEEKLSQWNQAEQNRAGKRNVVPIDRQKTDQIQSKKQDQDLDLYDVIAALGERAQSSIWLVSDVDCSGENADELFSFTGRNLPIEGEDFLRIIAGIRQTIEGDFQAFDPGATSYWIFIRAWQGSGFYVETNDPKSMKRLKSQFQSIEEVEGAPPPFEGFFIHI